MLRARGSVARRSVALVAITIVAVVCVPVLVTLVWRIVTGDVAESVPGDRLLALLGNTLLLMLGVTAVALTVGTATAWLTTRTDLPFARFWSAAVMVPLVIPAYLFAVALGGMLGGSGVLTEWLAPFGVERLPVPQGYWAALLCIGLSGVPVVHALVQAGLSRLDPASEESARLLGDPPARVFRRVVLPQLRTPLTVSAIVVSLYTLSDFGAVAALRYDTFTRAVYAQFRGRVDLAPAFALCGALVAVAAILIVARSFVEGRAVPVPARARPARRSRLGRAGAAACIAALTLYCTVTLALPITTLAVWAVRGLAAGVTPEPVLVEAVNSLRLAIGGALVTTALAIPLAVAARRSGVVARLIEGVPWIAYSLPSLAIGLAALVISVQLPSGLYQSTTVLLIVYATISLPIAVGAIQVGLRQIDPRLFDAARTLRSGPVAVGRRIVFPLVWRAVATALLLVALTLSHELPVTMLLRPSGTETLAIRVWGSVVEGQYTSASLAGLLLIAVSVPFVAAHALRLPAATRMVTT